MLVQEMGQSLPVRLSQLQMVRWETANAAYNYPSHKLSTYENKLAYIYQDLSTIENEASVDKVRETISRIRYT